MLRVRPQVTRIGPNTLTIPHRVAPVTQVKPGREPYHQVEGWRFENNTWKGNFRVGDRTFPGEVWPHYGRFGARIGNLPTAVISGPHGACFTAEATRLGWYRIHFAHRPETLDGAILAVEQSVREGLR